MVLQSIDESSPGVQDLIAAGYNTRDAVEAIEQSRGDVQEAMMILDARESEELGEVSEGLFVRSTSREETVMEG